MKKITFIALLIGLTSLFAYSQELALANQDGKFGYISKSGEWHIKPQFKIAKDFSEDLAQAFDGNRWGFINRKGEWIIQPDFEKTKSFNSGIAVVLKDKKWFYINKKGKKVLEKIITDKVYNFVNGYDIIKRD